MKEFYTAYYTTVERSAAHYAFCERVFGRDLCQHGFTDMEQCELLLRVAPLGAGQNVLDLGCGNGMITEYLSDCTGAQFTGLDYIAEAIERAQRRTAAKAGRLSFQVGDINRLDLPRGAYDLVLSIDTIYFSDDYAATVGALNAALRPSGRLAFFYSQGREPWVPREQFDAASILPDNTPLARALSANGLAYRTWNLTAQDYRLAQRRKAVLPELKAQFEAEGAQFIYDNRIGDADGVSQAIEEGLHARYLYLAQEADPL
ncbi:MAG: methyltransferase domain-containing protein [Chloroflexi bacterium]|nr:methyltransferase domain-containing protein [Chloroflexota bacterium]